MRAEAVVLFLLFAASTVAAAEPSDPVVATVDGVAVRLSDVEPAIEQQLRDLRQQEYDLKREAVEQVVFRRLQESLAEKEGISLEALRDREITAKAAVPSAEQVQATMQQYRAQLPPDEAEAKALVESQLTQFLRNQREIAWRRELLADADYDLRLDPVRYPIVSLPSDAIIGSADAAVTITEYSDFQCPYCARSQDILEAVMEQYDGKVRIVFKQFPLDIHAQARLAAEASLCARDQGRFEALHDWLFANPRQISVEQMAVIAPELEIDPVALRECLAEGRHTAAVEQQVVTARELGVDRTPMFFINGRRVASHSVEALSAMIEEELELEGIESQSH